MRILQFISSSGFFGAENVVLQLAVSLDKLGADITVGVFNNSRNPHLELFEECHAKKIKTKSFNCRGRIDFAFVRTLREFVIDGNIDIIHSHGYKSNIYAYLATMGAPVHRIATCHNWIGSDPKMKFYAKLDRFILRKFSHIIAVSSQVSQQLLLSRVRPDKVQFINNGIDTDVFFDAAPASALINEFGVTAENHVIVTVGRISEEKGHVFLLKAFKEISSSCPGVKLLIVGDGPLRQKLESEFAGPNIIFTGNRRDVAEIYRLMDIFVLPSLTEGLPMVLLEAMSSGKAVVASRVGEIPAVVEKNNVGVLVAPGSEMELQHAISRLLDSPVSLKESGVNAREVVKEKYSAKAMGQAYFKVYKAVTRTAPRGITE
jgi:glycosyltransferase involved in cell wall biosynthesis